ncbi:ABC transporter substrate-binding protein [Inquilinus sp. Marseille-Q2685]|uniref:ABC transporter substrate-binding protein n=1 Tax=Inquilinus sp. Marseille-Q2685 TaxID=2866581 RepID=UPI001CE44EBF|nr:extracellular solute-binding protein [Inquilinus sp. Marseille-Q2685]
MTLGRRIFAIAAAGLLAAAALGTPARAEGIALRMTVWTGNKAHLQLLDEIAAAYRKDHPEVASITFETLPFDGYTTALTTQIAGGNAPDLAWIFENSAPDFVSSGVLLPLQDILRSTPDYGYEDLLPSATALWRRDDVLYAYPFSTSPFGVFVNLDLLKQAGVKPPAERIAAGEWTWDTAIADAAAVRAKTGKAGLVVRDFDYKLWDNLATIWNGWGAAPWSADGKACGFDQPPMAEAMRFLHKAVFTDQAMPGPGAPADFFAGDAAMTITQISRAALLKDGAFAWDLVPLPKGPAGEYAVIGQAGIGVFKAGPNAQAAAAFLAFLTNPENSAKLAQFFPPPRKSQLGVDLLAKANPMLKPGQIEAVVVRGIEIGAVKPSHTGNAQIAQVVRAGLDALWQPAADIDAALRAVCGRIRPLLAR